MENYGSHLFSGRARGIGRSMACVLKTIALAMESPNTTVRYYDHLGEEETLKNSEAYAFVLSDICMCLGLKNWHVGTENGYPTIRFSWDT